MAEKTMTGKTLFVSGGTRGIGKAIVYEFASKGCDVAFTYASNSDIANEIITDLESNYGVKARAYKLDIMEPLTYKDVYKEFDEDFDRLDKVLKEFNFFKFICICSIDCCLFNNLKIV